MKRNLYMGALLIWAVAAPAAAGTLDTPGCKQDLAETWASMHEMLMRLRSATRGSTEERCTTYHHHATLVESAREVFARCKTGRDRDGDIAQMDGALDDVHGAIARDCKGR